MRRREEENCCEFSFTDVSSCNYLCETIICTLDILTSHLEQSLVLGGEEDRRRMMSRLWEEMVRRRVISEFHLGLEGGKRMRTLLCSGSDVRWVE